LENYRVIANTSHVATEGERIDKQRRRKQKQPGGEKFVPRYEERGKERKQTKSCGLQIDAEQILIHEQKNRTSKQNAMDEDTISHLTCPEAPTTFHIL